LQTRRTAEFILQDGWLRLSEGDSAGARADAEEVLRHHPDHVPALRILAESYAAQKENAKAEEVLKAAAAANPQSAQIQNLLGDWFQRTKNAAGARKAFEAAVAADPKSIEAALALAVLDIGENHTEAARRRLHDLLIIAPANVDALLMSGGVAMRAGGRQEAEKSYRAVLRIDESNVMALNNLAYLLVDSNPDEALKLATQAATIAPDNATVQDTLGWVFYRKRIFRSAVQYLEMAVKKEPTPRRQFHLGLTYLKCGDRDRGERTMELALRQDPNLLKAEDTWR
jgi:Tfp pilus assembly protein PilF